MKAFGKEEESPAPPPSSSPGDRFILARRHGRLFFSLEEEESVKEINGEIMKARPTVPEGDDI